MEKHARKVVSVAASFRPQKSGIGFSVNARGGGGRRGGWRVARRRSGSDILYCQIPTRQIHNCVNAGTARVLAATTARRAMASCGCKRDRDQAVEGVRKGKWTREEGGKRGPSWHRLVNLPRITPEGSIAIVQGAPLPADNY